MIQPGAILCELHEKQTIAYESEATEILFGGAAGGGKSHTMRVAAVSWASSIPGLQVYLFRRLRDDLIKNHIEGPQGLRVMLQPWVQNGSCEIVGDEVRFWNGSRIYLCHCKDEKDRFKYQGSEIHVLLVDELTHFTEVIYRFLRSRVRMVGINIPPGEFQGRFPRILLSANPGNVGHQWVKAQFIDSKPPFEMWQTPIDEGGMLRQFIPARLDDNPSMTEQDPAYRYKLGGLGNPELVKAMLEGDWNVVAGAFYPEWQTDLHVVTPRTMPLYWHRFRSFDWGSARPFACHWWAVSDGELPEFPRGALVCYREWYGAARDDSGRSKPNTGLRLTAEEVADGIKQREVADITGHNSAGRPRNMGGVADPSIFSQDGGPSLADRMAKRGVFFTPADNKRVGTLGAMGGWDQLRARLKGDGDRPAIYWFDTCVDTIRTLPALQADESRPEDCDCWVAGTLIDTSDGPKPIETIEPGDIVDTPIGSRPVLRAYLSGASETVWVTLADGRTLEGTPHHKIYVRGRGLVALSDLECHMILEERIKWSRSLNTAVSSIVAIRDAFTTIRAAAETACIGGFGKTIEVLSLSGMTSTIETTTTITTPSPILNAWPDLTIRECISKSVWPVTLDNNSRSGVVRTKVGPSFERTLERCTLARLNGNVRADIVALLSLRDTLTKSFVRIGAPIRSLMRSVKSAASRLCPSLTQRGASAPARIVAVGRCVERMQVYNLTVADAHLFYANGVISSNTEGEDHAADSIRYACLSRPYTAPLPEDMEPTRDRYSRRWKPRKDKGSWLAA